MDDLSKYIESIEYNRVTQYTTCRSCESTFYKEMEICTNCGSKDFYVQEENALEQLVDDTWSRYKDDNNAPSNDEAEDVAGYWIENYNKAIEDLVNRATQLNIADEVQKKQRDLLIYIVKQYLIFKFVARVNADNYAHSNASRNRERYGGTQSAYDHLFEEAIEDYRFYTTLTEYYISNQELLHRQQQGGIPL